MAAGSAAQDAWVGRVLGVDLGGAAGGGAPELGAALAAWEGALEIVNGQITALQGVLRNSPDDELHDIAEFGLNAMTANHRVKIQVALMDIRSGRGGERAKAAAAKLVGSFLGHIGTDKRIAACDSNPFGVATSLRGTLGPPLEGLRKALGG
jgi:hypothetical protein